MSVFVLLSGVLFRAPEQRIAKSGKPFWSATLRVKDGAESAWWKLLVFSETAGAELVRLQDGDALSAQGTLKVETYEKDGATRVSMTCFADRVLPLKPVPRERKQKTEKPAPPPDTHTRAERLAGDGVDEFHDEIPF